MTAGTVARYEVGVRATENIEKTAERRTLQLQPRMELLRGIGHLLWRRWGAARIGGRGFRFLDVSEGAGAALELAALPCPY